MRGDERLRALVAVDLRQGRGLMARKVHKDNEKAECCGKFPFEVHASLYLDLQEGATPLPHRARVLLGAGLAGRKW